MSISLAQTIRRRSSQVIAKCRRVPTTNSRTGTANTPGRHRQVDDLPVPNPGNTVAGARPGGARTACPQALINGQARSDNGRNASSAGVEPIGLYTSHSCLLSEGFLTSNR
jgi:hypothetical protein